MKVFNGKEAAEQYMSSHTLTFSTPDPSLVSKPSNIAKCSLCGSDLRQNAKFCTNCGNKI